jgi:prefoldin alpha subunit
VRQQLNQELEHLTASYGQLRSVQSRFKACVEALKSFTPSRASNPTLIPLTASLYVPGKLKNIENVIVDVGTGYYVEKSTADARKMYEEKIKYVGENLEKLQGTIEKKQDNLRVVGDVLQMVSDLEELHSRSRVDAVKRKDRMRWKRGHHVWSSRSVKPC